MINDGREFLIKRRRGNSAKCSAFSLWRSQSENRVLPFFAAARARAGVFCLRPYRAARTGGAVHPVSAP